MLWIENYQNTYAVCLMRCITCKFANLRKWRWREDLTSQLPKGLSLTYCPLYCKSATTASAQINRPPLIATTSPFISYHITAEPLYDRQQVNFIEVKIGRDCDGLVGRSRLIYTDHCLASRRQQKTFGDVGGAVLSKDWPEAKKASDICSSTSPLPSGSRSSNPR